MHRTILLLGAIASASAFSASRMGLRSSPTARSVSRSGATCVKMDASLVIASAPGLVAMGLSLANGMSCCAWVYLSLPPSLFHFLSFSLSPPTPLSFSLSLSTTQILGIITDELIPRCEGSENSAEGKVFYYKMQGDYHR